MSKSRYEPLVKLKKKALDGAERSLISANNALSAASDNLNRAYEELARMALPNKGSVGAFAQAAAMIHVQHQSIEAAKVELNSAKQHQSLMREKFKAAMIDYEKFKYLEVHEMNEKLKRLKVQEAKFLDEIGTMTFKRETA
ncbi:MAG: flagellar FliJ family protein [Sulfuricurvum sp.]|nr:flagellar FliJ family protein [Sulfuricurvum sp.]